MGPKRVQRSLSFHGIILRTKETKLVEPFRSALKAQGLPIPSNFALLFFAKARLQPGALVALAARIYFLCDKDGHRDKSPLPLEVLPYAIANGRSPEQIADLVGSALKHGQNHFPDAISALITALRLRVQNEDIESIFEQMAAFDYPEGATNPFKAFTQCAENLHKRIPRAHFADFLVHIILQSESQAGDTLLSIARAIESIYKASFSDEKTMQSIIAIVDECGIDSALYIK